MVHIKLPIIEDREGVPTEGILECFLDSSLACEETWAEQFPKLAERTTLMDYIRYWKDKSDEDGTMPIARILSVLKGLYCTIDFSKSKKEISFKEFLQLFTFNNPEFTKKVTDVLLSAIKELYPDSKKKD